MAEGKSAPSVDAWDLTPPYGQGEMTINLLCKRKIGLCGGGAARKRNGSKEGENLNFRIIRAVQKQKELFH